jgi:hypothetical protein
MKKLKFVSALIVLALFFSMAVYGVSFSDLSNHKWAEEAILQMAEAGYINGYDQGDYRPSKELTRGELVAIINRMNNFTEEKETDFTDVSSKHWAFAEIKRAYNAGYISGFPDNTFRPDELVTREQFAYILYKLYDLAEEQEIKSISDKNSIAEWSWKAIERVVANGLMKGYEDGSFRSLNRITRAEGAVALYNVINRGIKTKNIEEIVLESPAGAGGGVSAGESDETIERLKSVVSKMESRVLPILTTDLQIESAEIIISAIKSYIDNQDYDIEIDVEIVRDLGSQMNEEEKQEFRNSITRNIPMIELITLNNTFNLF